MNQIDYKFANYLSSRLEFFEVKNSSPFRANFRCAICGDSKKSKYKKRGWILEKDNKAFYYCHNCGASYILRDYLKFYEPALYDEYVFDMIKEKTYGKNYNTKVEKKQISNLTYKNENLLKDLVKLDSLEASHPSRRYCEQRKLPLSRIYYTKSFSEFINNIKSEKILDIDNDHRIVLPICDQESNIIGFSGRTILSKKNRYLTIMINDGQKVFGLEKVDKNRNYFILEGPLDSLFFENAIAMIGSDVSDSVINENGIFVFDNEPRNKEIVNKIEKKIDKNYRICLWPKSLLKFGKDINEYVLSGFSPKELEKIILKNTYQGLMAKHEFMKWKKVNTVNV